MPDFDRILAAAQRRGRARGLMRDAMRGLGADDRRRVLADLLAEVERQENVRLDAEHERSQDAHG